MSNAIYYQQDGKITDLDIASALEGFSDRECSMTSVSRMEIYTGLDLKEGDIFIGGVKETRHVLRRNGLKCEDIDYPEELRKYLHRKIYQATVKDVYALKGIWFVKPVASKAFVAGVCVDGMFIDDPYTLETMDLDAKVWVSELINNVEGRPEYRCYILDKQIIDVRRYSGGWNNPQPLYSKIMKMVDSYVSSPRAYAIDVLYDTYAFLSNEDRATTLIEVNDGWSLGNYGMDSKLYANMIEARWNEFWLTKEKKK